MFAAAPEVNTSTEICSISANETVQPRISWTGTARLTTSGYNNVTSSNNIFPDSPTVSSNANNAGSVWVRVVDGSGAQIGTTKVVKAGGKVTLDQIPALSGTYTIQAKAVSVGGVYTFSIT